MNDTILSVRGVEKSYISGSEVLRVLKDVNLEVRTGESISIMGTSGSGKSTLLNLIGGLDKADSGEIHACGYNITGMGEKEATQYRSEVVGFVFQFHYLLKDFTALENVMLPMLMQGVSRKRAETRALEFLDQAGVAERSHHYPSQLSGGERQRAALARALVNNPKLIIADEPTGNLDEEHRAMVTDLIFDLLLESGKSLLLVTHAEDLARKADRMLYLKEGLLQQT